MDFHQLLARMKEINQPTTESTVDECGEPMGMPGPSAPETPPPTVSINMNAQGVENISSLMQLLMKVNPDLGPKAGAMAKPAMTDPVIAIGTTDDEQDFSLGKDMDSDDDLDGEIDPEGADQDGGYGNEPDEKYADIDDVTKNAGGGMNGPKNPKDLRIKDPSPYENEAYANEPDEEYEDHLKMIKHLAGGMNKEKEMVKHGYQQGDNPKSMKESDDPLAQIKNDLYARLQEFKSR